MFEYPAQQMQLSMELLPAGELDHAGQLVHTSEDVALAVVEYLPVRQSIHALLPDKTLNLPDRHAVHAKPSAPNQPGLQRHLVTALLPAGELELTRHN